MLRGIKNFAVYQIDTRPEIIKLTDKIRENELKTNFLINRKRPRDHTRKPMLSALTPTEEVLRFLAATYSHLEKLEQMLERIEDNQFFMVSKISYVKTLTSQFSGKEKKRESTPCKCETSSLKEKLKLFLSSDMQSWTKQDLLHKLNDIVFPEQESAIDSSDSKSHSAREEPESNGQKKLLSPKLHLQPSDKLVILKSKGENLQTAESLRRLTDSQSRKSSKFIQFKKPSDKVPEEGLEKGQKVNSTANPAQSTFKFFLSLTGDFFSKKEKTQKPTASSKPPEVTQAQLPRIASHKFILKRGLKKPGDSQSKNEADSEIGVSKKDTNVTNNAQGNNGPELREKPLNRAASKLFIQPSLKRKNDPDPQT